jgi:hypothetical protein
MADDDVEWLTRWYLAQCDEDWEHQYGVTIDTLDNPGWRLSVDLEGTPLEDRAFEPICDNVDDQDAVHGPSGDFRWLICKREGQKFIGYGGPRDLGRLIRIFRTWAMGAQGD